MSKNRRNFTLAAFVIFFAAASSASALELEAIKNSNGRTIAFKVGSAKATTAAAHVKAGPVDHAIIARDFVNAHRAILGVRTPTKDLIVLAPDGDKYSTRVRYHQRFKGIPVLGAGISVHMNPSGEINYVKTKMVKRLPAKVRPSISARAARALAIKYAASEAGAKKLSAVEISLVILPLGFISDRSVENAHLSWKVTVRDVINGGEGYDGYGAVKFIDAQSGRELLTISEHQNDFIPVYRQVLDCAAGTGNTCMLNGHSMATCASGIGTACASDIGDPNFGGYVWGRMEGGAVRGAYPNPNPSPAPYTNYLGTTDVDKFYDYLGGIHNYWFNNLGISGANNQGGSAVYWGSKATDAHITRGVANPDSGAGTGGGINSAGCPGYAFFANSTGSIYSCVKNVSPDVIAHEYTHAVVYHSFPGGSDPLSYDVEGMLNEGTADFMGELFELSYTGTSDWRMGTGTQWPNIRDVRNPRSLNIPPTSLPYPDRLNAAGYYCGIGDQNGVHYNSTVLSHALYLIAQGGEFNGCTIQAQGIDVAQKIIFKGWRSNFTTMMGWNEAYNDLIQACGTMFSTSVCSEVTKALQAAEMNQSVRCSGAPELPPACAVNNAGTLNTTYRQRNVTTTYAPNEQIWVSGAGGVPGKVINFYLQPHAASIGTWSAISGVPTASTTIAGDATSRQFIATAGAVGQYDIIVDANGDGFYQPWADSILQIEVKLPVNNDGACYRGDSYLTSENCHDEPADCKCPATYACINGNFNPSNPFYMCWPTIFEGRS